MQKSGAHGLGRKELPDNSSHSGWLKLLATKNVHVRVVCLLAKVGGNVRSLDELHERKAHLIVLSEAHHGWAAVGYHVNVADELIGKARNVRRASNG